MKMIRVRTTCCIALLVASGMLVTAGCQSDPFGPGFGEAPGSVDYEHGYASDEPASNDYDYPAPQHETAVAETDYDQSYSPMNYGTAPVDWMAPTGNSPLTSTHIPVSRAYVVSDTHADVDPRILEHPMSPEERARMNVAHRNIAVMGRPF